MNDIIVKCSLVLNKLHLFSSNIIYLGPNIQDDRIEVLEDMIGFNMPQDFKCIIKNHNGISLFGTQVHGMDKSLRKDSLEEIYKFEHFQTDNRMPAEFLPFSPDGAGNYYCLNLKKLNNGICPVVFWQWNYSNRDKVEECNSSFLEWVEEVMIEWTLEDYDYDGTEKI